MSLSKTAKAVLNVTAAAALSLFSAQALAADDSDTGTPLKVCGVPQTYNLLSRLELNRNLNISTRVAAYEELYASISNSQTKLCDVLLSPDERLPSELIRSGKARADSLEAFAKVDLILWSPNPRLFNPDNGEAVLKSRKIASVAAAKPELTSVGFASLKAMAALGMDKGYYAERTYRSDSEYQVYSMVNEGNVDAGFITTPLISTLTRMGNGSYWKVPESSYPEIRYYAVVMEDTAAVTGQDQSAKLHELDMQKRATEFIDYLRSDEKSAALMRALGFTSI